MFISSSPLVGYFVVSHGLILKSNFSSCLPRHNSLSRYVVAFQWTLAYSIAFQRHSAESRFLWTFILCVEHKNIPYSPWASKWRAGSKALGALGGCCCSRERHQAVGGLGESTKKREGYWEFSQFCLGLVLFIRIFRELMHWEDIRFSFLVSLSLSFREKGA